MTSYAETERARAAAWKQATVTLPPEAKHPAAYVGKDGNAHGPSYEFCLPPEYADHSLLPEIRSGALDLFRELGIPWHAGVNGGPSSHLLSSQVQCVNALAQMVHDPERLIRAFADPLDTAEVLPIEPGRYLTFEYIGPADYLGEAPRGRRTRGAHCTSVDAAFLHRTGDGRTELILIEWKYTESYRRRTPDPTRDTSRWRRYGRALHDPAGPVDGTAMPFASILVEPFYQLVRQQLLAHALETDRVLTADRVRIVHVLPAANTAYQRSLTPAHQVLGNTVHDVWQRLLRQPDRFVALDSGRFAGPAITSAEYASRYGHDPAHRPVVAEPQTKAS